MSMPPDSLEPDDNQSESFLVVPRMGSAETEAPSKKGGGAGKKGKQAAEPEGSKDKQWVDVLEEGGDKKDLYFSVRQMEDTVDRFQHLLKHSQSRVDSELLSLRQGLDKLGLCVSRLDQSNQEHLRSMNAVFKELGQERMELMVAEMGKEGQKPDKPARATSAEAEGQDGDEWQQQQGRRRGRRGNRSDKR
jgi:hypothetical protein